MFFCSFLISLFLFQSSIVVEVPPYNKRTTDPIQVQFYISNGKRKRSLTQSFTYLPGVRSHLPVAAVKQERWETDHVSLNPLDFCPISCQVPSCDRARPDVVYYDSCDIPVHCGPPSENTPRLHHHPPPPPSVPLQTSLMFPHTSSMPLRTSPSVPSQTSMVTQTLIPLPTSIMPHQISTISSQASSVSLQTFNTPATTSSGGPQREPSPSLSSRRAFVTPAEPQKDSLLASPGEVPSIKQEPEDSQPNPGSLGLQEITLDDGRKLHIFINELSCCRLEKCL